MDSMELDHFTHERFDSQFIYGSNGLLTRLPRLAACLLSPSLSQWIPLYNDQSAITI